MKKRISKTPSFEEEIVKLLVLQLRKGGISHSELIIQMAGIGFSNKRVAELLSTTSNTVNVTLQRAKKKNKKK